jgi:hypothetical protein
MTDSFELIRLRRRVDVLDNLNQTHCEFFIEMGFEITGLKKENNRLKYELARYQGKEAMSGGREGMVK